MQIAILVWMDIISTQEVVIYVLLVELIVDFVELTEYVQNVTLVTFSMPQLPLIRFVP